MPIIPGPIQSNCRTMSSTPHACGNSAWNAANVLCCPNPNGILMRLGSHTILTCTMSQFRLDTKSYFESKLRLQMQTRTCNVGLAVRQCMPVLEPYPAICAAYLKDPPWKRLKHTCMSLRLVVGPCGLGHTFLRSHVWHNRPRTARSMRKNQATV